MTFATTDLVVNGALEESEWFGDYAVLADYVEGLDRDALDHGYPAELFVIWHDHDDTGESCECVQYLTDHHPYRTWNRESERA